MDEDLDAMSREQLISEARRLREGIRSESNGQELCWHHPDLWALLPDQRGDGEIQASITVPEWPKFMRGCIRYRQSLDEQAPDAPRTQEEWRAPRCQPQQPGQFPRGSLDHRSSRGHARARSRHTEPSRPGSIAIATRPDREAGDVLTGRDAQNGDSELPGARWVEPLRDEIARSSRAFARHDSRRGFVERSTREKGVRVKGVRSCDAV